MRDVEELHFERTKLNLVLAFDDVDLRVFKQSVLRQLVLHESHREAAAVQRNIQIRKNERQRADVIFVGVRQEDGFDFTSVLEKKGDIGNDDIDPEEFFVRKHYAGIDD